MGGGINMKLMVVLKGGKGKGDFKIKEREDFYGLCLMQRNGAQMR